MDELYTCHNPNWYLRNGSGGSGGSTSDNVNLSSLKIGGLNLAPEFAPDMTNYAVKAIDTTNVITAVPEDSNAKVEIFNGKTAIENGKAGTWNDGFNNLTIKVTNGKSIKEYKVLVVKNADRLSGTYSNGVASNDIFIVYTGGNSNKYSYITDGIDFTEQNFPQSGFWNLSSNGKAFLANNTTSNTVLYSVDAIKWDNVEVPRPTTSTTTYTWQIKYENNMFLGAIQNPCREIVYSKDGKTWNKAFVSPEDVETDILVPSYTGEEFFVTQPDIGNLFHSTDGLTWDKTTIPTGYGSILHKNNIYLAVPKASSYSNKIAYSMNGVHWEETTLPETQKWAIFYFDKKFFATDSQGTAKPLYSDDGISWNQIPDDAPSESFNTLMPLGNKLFWGRIYGSEYMNLRMKCSLDGEKWQDIVMPKAGMWGIMLFTDGKYLFVDMMSNDVIYSVNGIDWI